jgi:hypothetical protein
VPGLIGADHALRDTRPRSQFCMGQARSLPGLAKQRSGVTASGPICLVWRIVNIRQLLPQPFGGHLPGLPRKGRAACSGRQGKIKVSGRLGGKLCL